MVEYPFVFDHRGSRYMLYNGNGYGATGIERTYRRGGTLERRGPAGE